MNKLSFLKALFSPFKPFKLKWYCGKIAIGTPYFFPRRWVYYTKKEAIELASKKQYPENVSEDVREKLFKNMVESYKTTQYPKTKRISFDFVGLGWKTKWTDTDYRFEWSPVWSFVFFKWQIAVTVVAPELHHYWEAWLYYENNTDKSLSQEERIKQCIKEFPLSFKVSNYGSSNSMSVNYYYYVLKKKYHKFIK
jgi:hypothetical protein